MAFGDWFGNKGSIDAIDELYRRAKQRNNQKDASEAKKQIEIERQRQEYVNQLQQQYHLQQQQFAAQTAVNMGNNLYNGYSQLNVDPNTLQAIGQNQWSNFPGGITGIATTGGLGGLVSGPTTAGGYLSTVTSSTSPIPPQWWQGYNANPTPITPMAVNPTPSKGDRVEFEFDGQSWNLRTEVHVAKGFERRHIKKCEFSLDEIDEAQKLIEELGGKEKELVQANV